MSVFIYGCLNQDKNMWGFLKMYFFQIFLVVLLKKDKFSGSSCGIPGGKQMSFAVKDMNLQCKNGVKSCPCSANQWLANVFAVDI
jgi:hypothetical protein